MNKIVNINLGGYPFAIDDDAYHSLSKYLKTIDSHFSKSAGHEDIVFDIENRMAELLKEKTKSNGIVSQKHVDEIVEIMGRPESFTDETHFEEEWTDAAASDSHGKKRLFRNPDDKVLGGVCSGLASYFGVEKALYVRLIFLFFFFFAGMGTLVYILLWIFVPTAKSSSDFLMMRGEPINASTIAKTVEQELHELKNKISDLGNEFKNMKFL